ncbi:MAG: hypothetical protein HQ464_15800, partial [Planctomycetes bacterium]|nr:hypothetical protein [Planctomycetota bacterium]
MVKGFCSDVCGRFGVRRAARMAWAAVIVCKPVCWAVCWAAIVAQPAAAHWNNFNSVRPRCGQAGTTVEVTISGSWLVDPQEFIFYRPGIRAVEISYDGKPEGGTLKCKFEIAPDCPLGEHPFRIRTRTQLTNAATFHISPFPVVEEMEEDKERKTRDNDSLATSMAVPS